MTIFLHIVHLVLILLICITKDLFSQFCSHWKILTLSYMYDFPVSRSIGAVELELFKKVSAFEALVFVVIYLLFYNPC